MVPCSIPTTAILFAQQASRLPPPLRAKAMLALLGLVVLGIGMATLIVLGGRIVKRLARYRHRASNPRDDAWYQKPLEPEAPAASPAPDDHDK